MIKWAIYVYICKYTHSPNVDVRADSPEYENVRKSVSRNKYIAVPKFRDCKLKQSWFYR